MHRIRQHGEVYFTRLEVLPNIISSGMDIMSQLSSLASPETFATLYPVLACISYSAELRHRLEHREQTGLVALGLEVPLLGNTDVSSLNTPCH